MLAKPTGDFEAQTATIYLGLTYYTGFADILRIAQHTSLDAAAAEVSADAGRVRASTIKSQARSALHVTLRQDFWPLTI